MALCIAGMCWGPGIALTHHRTDRDNRAHPGNRFVVHTGPPAQGCRLMAADDKHSVRERLTSLHLAIHVPVSKLAARLALQGVSNCVGSPNDNRDDTDKSVRQILNQMVIHPRVPHLCVRTNL